MSTNAPATELPKSYDPASIEPVIYQAWLDEKCFHAKPSDPGEPYSIVIPPPNVTGALHLGHALNNTLQDILIRKARMEGKNAVWIPGLDHAGIATQAVVEKQLKENENKTRHDVGREGLVERIWQWKQQYGDRIISQLKRMGCSCDWDRQRFTLDDTCAKAVRETFFKLFKDGLIYRGKRLVNWDVHLQTSISDDELYDETVKTSMWHIRYPIVPRSTGFQPVSDSHRSSGVPPVPSSLPSFDLNSNKEGGDEQNGRDARATGLRAEHGLEARATAMTVATTRPETMLADTAVAVHPDDARWNWAIGMEVELPLTGRRIPIIADPILVDMAFGSGCVKVTPAHDPNDYAVWQRQNGAIEIKNLMTLDGKVNDADGSWSKYTGLKFADARKRVVEDLIAGGFMTEADIKPHEANVKFSDRSKTAIQPFLSDQWFVKMAPLAEPALEVVRDGTIKFFPERHAQQYLSWLGEKRDWPISRQLWWGHRIPVWTFIQTNSLPRDWYEKIQNWQSEGRCAMREDFEMMLNLTFEKVDDHTARLNKRYICIRQDDVEVQNYLKSIGGIQDPDVLDTWFSSALWPHSTLGWPEQTADLAKWYPTSVLLTGRDIITLWVARMVMTGIYNMGPRSTGILPVSDAQQSSSGVSPVDLSPPSAGFENNQEGGDEQNGRDARATARLGHGQDARATGVPFSHVAINPTILDGRGERMSKSKGNGVDPVDIIELYGADAMRFTLTTMATETQDVRMPVKKLADGRNSSEKFDLGRNFCNKLWNASRFAFANIEQTRGTGFPPVSDAQQRSSGVSPVELSLHSFDSNSIKEEGEKNGRDARVTGFNSDKEEGDEQNGRDAWVTGFNSDKEEGDEQNGRDARATLRAEDGRDARGTLVERWILSRLTRTIQDANAALAVYRFDLYAKACYDFFWRDFCDWYVEIIKPDFKDPARAQASARTLSVVLDATFRLMHPMIPFVTEALWGRLVAVWGGEIPALKGVAWRGGTRLMLSGWPVVDALDEGAERMFSGLQDVIGTIRNVRNEHKVDQKKTVVVSLVLPGEDAARGMRESVTIIENLAGCTVKAVETNLVAPDGAVRMTINGCEVYIEGLSDPAATAQLDEKKRVELVKKIGAMKGRLSNESYIAKAPVKLVEETKQQLQEAETELARLEGR